MKAFVDVRIVMVLALLLSAPAGAQPAPASSLRDAAQTAVLFDRGEISTDIAGDMAGPAHRGREQSAQKRADQIMKNTETS